MIFFGKREKVSLFGKRGKGLSVFLALGNRNTKGILASSTWNSETDLRRVQFRKRLLNVSFIHFVGSESSKWMNCWVSENLRRGFLNGSISGFGILENDKFCSVSGNIEIWKMASGYFEFQMASEQVLGIIGSVESFRAFEASIRSIDI
ncbi:unnamed protein product [Rhizophagus irregularis]|nr:unnamed protein product [Rhizophagus irregularis]